MHELPQNFNKILPPHKAMKVDGTFRDVECRAGQVRDIETDAGLFIGGCGGCCAEFIYMFRSNSWMIEGDFEKLKREGANGIRKELGKF